MGRMKSSFRRFKFVGLGFVLGIVVLILQIIFEIPDAAVRKGFFIGAPIVIIGAMIINIVWQINFQKKARKLFDLLKKDNKPDLFIKENEKLLNQVRSPYNIAFISINLSVGYAEMKDYEKALEVLEQVPLKGLKGINKIVYYVNQAYYYFMLGDQDSALNIIDTYQSAFREFEEHQSLGKHIKLNQVFYLSAKDQIEEAEALLASLKKTETDKGFLKTLEEIELREWV